jgi:hypothetical protein
MFLLHHAKAAGQHETREWTYVFVKMATSLTSTASLLNGKKTQWNNDFGMGIDILR